MMKISVCILAKNEENNIADCIKSIKNIADEIIVVDNGSDDCTIRIASSLGSRVIDGSNLLFDNARELYLKEAKYNWILILDADERFEEDGAINLKDFLSKTPDNVWGYQVLSYQHLGKGKWSEIHNLKLIRNNKKIHYNNSPIHASMSPSIYGNNAIIEKTNLFFIHHLDVLTQGRPAPKRERYRNLLIDILSKDFINIDKDMIDLYKCFLGLEYVAVGEYIRAEEIYKEVVDKSFRYQNFAIQCLCQLYMFIGHFDKAKEYIIPRNLPFLKDSCVLGNYYYHVDKQMVIEYYEDAIKNNKDIPSNYLNLSYLLQKTDKKRAIELLQIAISKNSFLSKEIAYIEGEKPNLFDIQSNILFVIEDVYTLFENLKMEHVIKGV